MKPYPSQQEAAVHLVGSPAQRVGAQVRPHDYSTFDVLVPPSLAPAAVSPGTARLSETSPPRAQVASRNNNNSSSINKNQSDPLVSPTHLGGAVMALTVPPPPNTVDGADVSPALLGTRDLQRGLLEQKLQHVQREANAVQEELKETGARLSHVTVKLNEQKVEFSALTHRYGAAVEKLTAAEGSVKRLEEQLVYERKQHSAVREERDGLKASLRELEWEVTKLCRELQEERERPSMDPREVERMLHDRSRFVPAAEVQRRCDEMRDAQQSLALRVASALDALLLAHEEDETAVFVARSAVLSAATDLEAKVAATEATLAALHDQMTLFNEGTERDMTEMISALIVENKELWQHLSKLKGDHDAAAAQVAALRRKGEYIPRDQYEYTQKQLTLTVERLAAAQKTVEEQIEVAREHEEQMKAVIGNNESLHDEVVRLAQQLAQVQEKVGKREQQLEEAKTAAKETQRCLDDSQGLLESERRRMNNTVQQLNENFTTMEKEYEQRIRHLNSERDAAREDVDRMRRELGDAQEQVESLQRDLAARTSYFENYRQQAEDHQQQVSRSLQEEMASTRELLEHELGLVRRELEEQRTSVREAERERDDERAERRAAQAVATGLEAEVMQQRRENEQLQRCMEEITARLQQLEAEADQLRQRRDDVGEDARQLQCELRRLQGRGKELEQQLQEERETHMQLSTQLRQEIRDIERSRASLQEELKKVRIRIAEVEQQKSVSRSDADKENLMRENVRLHEQYQEVQQENVTLREGLQQLRAKNLSCEQLSQQLDDVQERLRQLPTLRQAAEDAKRDAMRATEEVEALRQERDAMAAKLDFFLEESKQAAKKDEAWDRVFRDAVEQARRLGGQVSVAKQQQQQQRSAPVYATAHATGYSDQYSNYQRVLGNSSIASGGDGIAPRKLPSPSRSAVDASPQPSAPALHRPWR